VEVFNIKKLSFSYPESDFRAISDLDLSIAAGEWVTICGSSGCGKTTLLSLLKPSVAPGGDKTGEILFNGREISSLSLREQAAKIGFVMQNPDNQIVTDKVWHELAFGLESLGFESDVIRLRCAEMAAFFGIGDWFYADTASLSGGQKQLLNLASVMVMQPEILLLDEPTSQLDPIAASEFLQAVHKLNRELGTTIILTEHRLEEALPLSDRLLVMENGRIFAQGSPHDVIHALRKANHGIFRAMPTPVRVHAAVENALPCPLTVRQGRQWLENYAADHAVSEKAEPRAVNRPVSENAALEIRNGWYRYSKDGADVLRGVNLKVYPGTITALVGGNGAGKSTTLALAAGLSKPQQGKVVKNGKTALLPQNPQALFLRETLHRDLSETAADEAALSKVSELCNLSDLLDRHPFDLSGGELQRAALAKVLLTNPDILLLDEPTKGVDAEFKAAFIKILSELSKSGTSILMVSHDVEFCAECADVCAMMFDGEIVSCDEPCSFFDENSFYTTAANRMSRHRIDGAITAADVISACGGAGREILSQAFSLKTRRTEAAKPIAEVKSNRGPDSLIAALICLLLVPLTIWAGIALFDDRKYYLISLTVIAELSVPFFLLFEKRRPQAREIVLIAALCAIGVIGRAAFFWLPQFKPVAALIIISAVALGAERGFLIGALTCFASNLFFGQGPWTLWQMFAFGLIGFFAGLIFRSRKLSESRLAVCIYGFLSVIILYGGILNPAAEIMFQGYLTPQMLIASYIAGLPFDLIHAAGTVIFLWIAAKPMLLKLDRIKKKYEIK